MFAEISKRHRLVLSLRALSLGASLVVAGIGLLALIGWALDIPALKSVVPTLVAMKVNTAIGLSISGIALALLCWREPGRRLGCVISALGATVGLLGGLTLGEYVFGWDLGLDQIWFHEAANTIWTAQPGRMAPASAFCFVLMGLAILAAWPVEPARRRLPVLAGIGAAVAGIGALALAGCCAELFLRMPLLNQSGMAIHTAAAFLLLDRSGTSVTLSSDHIGYT